MPHRPALAATKVTALVAILPIVLLTSGVGHVAAAREATLAPRQAVPPALPRAVFGQTASRAAPGAGLDPLDRPGSDLTPEPLSDPSGPGPDRSEGLGVLTALGSGLRMNAFGTGSSRAADAAAVGMMPANGEDPQEWLVWPSADGELVLQSVLLSSTSSDVLFLTADPDGTVYLQHERSHGQQEDPGQLWRFTDRSRLLSLDAETGRRTERFRIRDHGDRCLLDHGYGERLTVGPCSDPGAWWTEHGLAGWPSTADG